MNRAVTALLNRHDNLRTAYVADLSGELAQIVLGEVDVPWRVVDLGAEPASWSAKLSTSEPSSAIDPSVSIWQHRHCFGSRSSLEIPVDTRLR